jgi:hypothetical protein
MKNLQLIPFKALVKNFCQELSSASISYIESDEFKTSQYDLYSPKDLLEAINNEEYEHKRTVLLCLLHYKMENRC